MIIPQKNEKPKVSDSLRSVMTGLGSKLQPKTMAQSALGNGFQKTGTIPNLIGKNKSIQTPERSNKVGSVDSSFYTTVASGTSQNFRTGDNASTISTKYFGLIKTLGENKKRRYELERNFEKESTLEEKRKYKELLKKFDTKKEESPKEETTQDSAGGGNIGGFGSFKLPTGLGKGKAGVMAKLIGGSMAGVVGYEIFENLLGETEDMVGLKLDDILSQQKEWLKNLTGNKKETSTTQNPTATRQPNSSPSNKTNTGISAAAALTIKGETGLSPDRAIEGVGQVVPNDPEPGVSSYGILGLNSKVWGDNSSVGNFIKDNPQFNFKETIASKEFDAEWKKVAKEKPQEMLQAQLAWYNKYIQSPLKSDLMKVLPEKLATDEKVLLYMSDRRNQYGKYDEVNALKAAASASTADDFIKKVSDHDRKDENIEKAFSKYLENNPDNKKGLINRIDLREKTASEYVQPPSATNVSSGFGRRKDPFSGKESDHTGIDIPATPGTPVNSTKSGRVVVAGLQPGADKKQGYGNLVVVDHGNGVITKYAHLSSIDVKVGDEVTEGQKLGGVGSTGSSTGPHLHYEILQQGKPVDPLTNALSQINPVGQIPAQEVAQTTGEKISSISTENRNLRNQGNSVAINNPKTTTTGSVSKPRTLIAPNVQDYPMVAGFVGPHITR